MKTTLKFPFYVLPVAAIAISSVAAADEHSGLSLGARLGYAVPFGDADKSTKLHDLTVGAAALQLDVGWRFDQRWLAGIYASLGPTMIAGNAKDSLRAAGATDVRGHIQQRVGVQGVYAFEMKAPVAPWVGLAVGYDWMRYSHATLPDGREIEAGAGGVEATVQGGADMWLGRTFTLGPFAAVSLGQYQSQLVWTEGSGNSSKTIDKKGLHEWVQIGFKGTFSL